MRPRIRGSGRPPPPLGLVLFKGRSKLDGKLIVAVATGFARPSCNMGTGPQVQTWILRADITPTGAVFTGEDRSVCGDCPHRGGACYVVVGRAPQQVFHAFKAARYPKYQPRHLDLFRRRPLRLGSYGDPAAVPTRVWRPLCQASGCWTGAWASVFKAAKKDEPFVVLGGAISTFASGSNVTRVPNGDGRWPAFDTILPKQKPSVEFNVNGRLFAELLAVAATFSPDGEGNVTVRFWTKDRPIVVTTANGTQLFFGMMMPLT